MNTVPLGPASPPALRLRRPGWRDTRLLLGLGLVGLSVALGATAFAAAARTVPVYAAAETLVPGEAVGGGGLVIREVRLADSLDRYLRADLPLPAGLVVTRTVAVGELVPASAVADAGDLGLRPVAVTPRGGLSSGVTEGAAVDLWFVPAPRTGAASGGEVAPATSATSLGAKPTRDAVLPTAPTQIASGLTVAEVTEPSGSFSVGRAVTVHVLVPVDDLAGVLAALAAEGSVEIAPFPGAAG